MFRILALKVFRLKSLLKKSLVAVFFCFPLVLMCGCWTWPSVKDNAGFDEQARYIEEGEPKIKPGLTLRVSLTASGAPEVQETLKEVNANGEILMPHIGAVKCDGLTVGELQEKIKTAYKSFFIDPQVSVGFPPYVEGSSGKSPWGEVLMMGEVLRPGPINMSSTRDLTVTRALMLAGGASAMADKSKVKVTRREKDGSLKKFVVNIDKIGKEGRSDLDIGLKPGDVVYVPESWY